MQKFVGRNMGSMRSPKVVTSLILIVLIIAPNIRELEGITVSSSISSKPGRHLLQIDNASDTIRQSDDTVRVDPLDHLKKYRGGYDITNKHYWSSTAFTGISGYVLALLWLLCGIGYGAYVLVTIFWFKNKGRKFKKRLACRMNCYLWPFLLAVFFTILAITASGLVLGGNAKLHSRAMTVVDILIDTADEASDTMYNTTGAMKNMSTTLAATNRPGSASNFLTSTTRRLDSEASDIQRQARKNRRAIEKGLKILYIITTLIISLNLIATIALTVFGALKLRRTFHLLIVLCWILTVFSWLLFGIYYFIGNFAGDTCTALEGFQQDPYNNSLSSLLPCDELLSARTALRDLGMGVHNIVTEVNRNISTRYGNIVQICNPFSGPPQYAYQPENCPVDTVRIGEIPELLKLLTCTEGTTCTGGILIPARDYNTVEAYTTSIERLLNVYPGMESLVECRTVTSAFSEILNNHCQPLKRYTRMVWAAMVFLSVVMVILVLIWTIEAHHEQHHHSSDGSVKPHSAESHVLESGKAETPSDYPRPSSIQ